MTEAREIDLIREMAVLKLEAGDVLVVTCDRDLPHEAMERVESWVSAKVGGHPVLVLAGGLKLGALRAAPPA